MMASLYDFAVENSAVLLLTNNKKKCAVLFLFALCLCLCFFSCALFVLFGISTKMRELV
jgi:hypothetical protein